MNLIDGKVVSETVYADLDRRVAALKGRGLNPGLAVILVGDNPASMSYVAGKEKTCRRLGIHSKKIDLPASTGEASLLKIVGELNTDRSIHGILVQSPLPKGLSETRIFAAIDPAKDVDGFHPVNVGNLVLEQKGFVSCTPLGIVRMLEHYKIPVEGKHAVVIGRSHIVGKPMALLLMQKSKSGNATVTVCHSKSENLKEICETADILIAAIGRAGFVTADFVKKGAVVVDVGINRVSDASREKGYRLVGDVDFDKVKEIASWITPVPGGVGLMTQAMLMSNLVDAAEQAAEKTGK